MLFSHRMTFLTPVPKPIMTRLSAMMTNEKRKDRGLHSDNILIRGSFSEHTSILGLMLWAIFKMSVLVNLFIKTTHEPVYLRLILHYKAISLSVIEPQLDSSWVVCLFTCVCVLNHGSYC